MCHRVHNICFAYAVPISIFGTYHHGGVETLGPLRAPGVLDFIGQIPSRECLLVLMDAKRKLS